MPPICRHPTRGAWAVKTKSPLFRCPLGRDGRGGRTPLWVGTFRLGFSGWEVKLLAFFGLLTGPFGLVGFDCSLFRSATTAYGHFNLLYHPLFGFDSHPHAKIACLAEIRGRSITHDVMRQIHRTRCVQSCKITHKQPAHFAGYLGSYNRIVQGSWTKGFVDNYSAFHVAIIRALVAVEKKFYGCFSQGESVRRLAIAYNEGIDLSSLSTGDS